MSRVFFGLGAVCLLIGGIAWTLERMGLTLGRLPGDIVAGSGGARIYFPITTCFLLSAALSAILFAARILHK